MIHFFASKNASAEKHKLAMQAWDKLIARQDLGFTQLPLRNENWLSAVEFANQLKKKSKHLIVVGLGGSALGGKCLVESLGDSSRVLFLYNTDPDTVDKVLSNEQYLDHSHFLFISKSGGTLELACIIDILQSQLTKRKRKLSDAISVITEEKASSLYSWAKEHSISMLAHPKDVGGRFSAFTAVGIVPAVFSGVSPDELQKGTQLGLTQSELVVQL
ncbi:MAG: hypothetical protein KDD38_07925, partial [Bdellovibrionales bacterium]|nr:hypothetical protein [Bdellovibrionales bacterium]